MTDTLFRSFSPDLEIRSAAKGGDGRTVVGIAVPYGKPQRIDERLTEQFARGAFKHQIKAAHRVKFAREHMALGGSLIGRLDVMRDDASGLYIEARVAKTPLGDETLALLEDGALNDLSIGFRTRQDRRLPGNVIERVTADLREVSVVLEGAYGEGAMVAALRSADEDAAPEIGEMSGCTCGSATRLDEARRVLAGLPSVLPL